MGLRRFRGKRGPIPSEAEAARFMHHAGFGCSEADIAAVQAVGFRHWIAGQSTKPRQTTFDALGLSGGSDATPRQFPEGLDSGGYSSHPTNGQAAIYAWFATRGQDQLRAKVAHALLQFIPIGSTDTNANNFWNYGGSRGFALFCDVLADEALGNYRTLLTKISTNFAMGLWLSHFKNAKETATTQPDENYAREVMQLFTIGLWQLNADGSRAQPETPTYTLDDVRGLARVFTGLCSGDGNWGKDWYSTDFVHPMTFNATYHESGEKTFLGVTIPANTNGPASLTIALDTLFNHPNCPPFVCDKLIRFMTTSNPSAAYVTRVAAAFIDNGKGVRGDMQAVVTAILMDPEARSTSGLTSPTWGKFRDAMSSLYGVIRTLGIVSPTNNPIDDVLANNGGGGRAAPAVLGSGPLYTPSVFNFFSPTYTPPGASFTAPELQTQTAVTVAGTVNELTRMPLDNWKAPANYEQWYSLTATPAALVDRLSLLLTGDQLSATTKSTITTGITGMATSTTDNKDVMIGTAAGLILASAEARVQK
jgi:uncharacterized protein (DUF1800 family)